MLPWSKNFIKLGFCLLALGSLVTKVNAQTDPVFVDKELMLEIDVSDSIDAVEYDQIIGGYANAFRDTSIQERIEKLQDGVAVGVQFFSSGQSLMVSNAQQYINDPNYDPTNPNNTPISSHFNRNAQWFVLRTANDADEFANFLDTFLGDRPATGNNAYSFNSGLCNTEGFADNGGTGIGTGTNIAGAIQQGTCEINRVNQRYSLGGTNFGNTNASTAKIVASYEQAIDISSDGVQNTDISGDNTLVVNGSCNDNNFVQSQCQAQLELGQDQSANLGRTNGNINDGIVNSPDFEWDSPITRINGLPVNNDIFYETEYFADGYDQSPIGNGPTTTIGPVVGGTLKDGDSDISNNVFDAGVDVNGSFVVAADDYAAFEPAITLKIEQELEPVPFEFKPGFGLLLGLGIFGVRYWLTKKANNKLVIKTESENQPEIDGNQPFLEQEVVLA